MELIDWIVLLLTITIIVGYGVWKTKGSKNIEGYLLGGNEAKWWTVGLSVMATQASAITFLSTPGQAFHDGMEFAQFYLMLPVAMVIICITFIPLFYKMKVYTAYEFLENRFDLKTRSLTSSLFLVQRGLATGITIYAPSIVISSVMDWNLQLTTICTGIIAIAYTVSGGTKAVHVTHRHQMVVILLSLFVIFFLLLNTLTETYTFSENLLIAKANEKLNVLDFTFDWNDRYNIWSSMAALFLFLSYFGTDQSQVQRYISGKSIRESRLGLIMNGILKLPLQFFILFLGIMVFLYYQSNDAPIFFNDNVINEVRQSENASELTALEDTYTKHLVIRSEANDALVQARRANDPVALATTSQQVLAISKQGFDIRSKVKALIIKTDKELETNDKDYVFISFILSYLPNGLIGLLLAVIFFAAMSSTSSELNALASTTTVDIYKRLIKQEGSEAHYLKASKMWTLFWGIVAILFASYCNLFENLIQFVNIIGSVFYGTILGIFLVAFYIKHIKGNAVFIGAVLAETLVIAVFLLDLYGKINMPFLWLNVIGVVAVIVFSSIVQSLTNNPKTKVETF